ncbi:hypothetical protein EKO27_g4176 [Xylaria grammica]|uniref:AmmeMemoRadiSam system protein B n=1 Tax=Xylaria grammica TaxID=363999 RepID=A0A439D984_9PEZI|nr:hypothetical protein EKO27_g4176 [Xylaria grammica]
MKLSGTRDAGKADSWYEGDPDVLSNQLDGFLSGVPTSVNNSHLPIAGAKVIIAPHAGYSYSGPCAAWAYKCLDLSKAKRIFLLGPSHTYYLRGCALTKFAQYATPFGDLTIDEPVVQKLRDTGKFQDMPTYNEVEEHSLEMHLPYIYKRITQTFSSRDEYPTLVPILIGDNKSPEEKQFGGLAGPLPSRSRQCLRSELRLLSLGTRKPRDPPIHESIKLLDELAMDAIASGRHDDFIDNLKKTKNTVCGRHPIGVTMAALEVLAQNTADADKYKFKFVQYQRSSLAEVLSDSSNVSSGRGAPAARAHFEN